MTSPGGHGYVALEDEPAVFVHDVLGAPGNPVRTSPGSSATVAIQDEPLTWFEVPAPSRTAPRIGTVALRTPPKATKTTLPATGWSPSVWGVVAVAAALLRLRSRSSHREPR
jgi:hypothetical protein